MAIKITIILPEHSHIRFLRCYVKKQLKSGVYQLYDPIRNYSWAVDDLGRVQFSGDWIDERLRVRCEVHKPR